MGGSIAPFPRHQLFTDSGVPASGHRLFTYLAGTTTKAGTFQNEALTSANTNAIVLDAAGRATIFLSPGVALKFVFASPGSDDPPASPIWTVDNVNSTRATDLDVDITGTAGETLTAGKVVYMSDGQGARTGGRWYKTDSSNTYSSTEPAAIGITIAGISTADTGSIRICGKATYAAAGLFPGVTYYIGTNGNVTAIAPTNARPIGVADDNATNKLVMSPWASGTRRVQGATTFADAVTLASTVNVTGLATFAVPPIGVRKFVRATAATTVNNSTTLVNVTGLTFAVAANETWAFDFVTLGVTTAAADWKFAVTCPTSPTAVQYGLVSSAILTAGATSTAGGVIELASGGLEQTIVIRGLIRNGANAGNVQLQMAQLTADPSNTVLRADSYAVAERTA